MSIFLIFLSFSVLFCVLGAWSSVISAQAYKKYLRARILTLDILEEYTEREFSEPVLSNPKIVEEKLQRISTLSDIIISEPIAPYKLFKFEYKYPFVNNTYVVEMLLSDDRGRDLYLMSK